MKKELAHFWRYATHEEIIEVFGIDNLDEIYEKYSENKIEGMIYMHIAKVIQKRQSSKIPERYYKD